MKPLTLFLLAVAAYLVTGCSSNDSKLDPPELRIGRQVKYDVLNFVAQAKRQRSTGMIAEEAAVLLETFEGYEENPPGVHEELIAKLHEKSKEVHSLAKSRGSRAQINAKLKELTDLAEKLPGEVKVNLDVE